MGLLAQIGFVSLVVSAVPFWIAFAYSAMNIVDKFQKKEIKHKKQEKEWLKRFGVLLLGGAGLIAISVLTGL